MSATARLIGYMITEYGGVLPRIRNGLLVALVVVGFVSYPAVAAGREDEGTGLTVPTLASEPREETGRVDAEAAPSAPVLLTPRMRTALDHVMARYKLSRETMQPVFEAVQRAGMERGIDPVLIVALISIESGFNPLAKGAAGGHGLMQIIPRFHREKMPDGKDAKVLFDPIVNVQVGAHVLDEAIRRAGSVVAGLRAYNGSKKKVYFANRVLAEKERLEAGAPASTKLLR